MSQHAIDEQIQTITPGGVPPLSSDRGLGEGAARRRREGLVARTPEVRAAVARQLTEARLRFLAPLLIVTIGGLCLRDSWLGGRALSSLELALAASAMLATALLFLPGSPSWSIPKLEAGIVWLAGSYLAARAYDPRSWLAAGTVPLPQLRHLDHTAVSIGLLIIAYSIAVPNSPRRAAAVITPLALTPLGVSLARLLGTPHIASPAVAAVLLTDALLIPVAATAVGLYAAYLLDSYREQLEQAKDQGRYLLERQIGSGGMGQVWLARHHLLARRVALKMIRAEHLRDRRKMEIAWQRFEREAQAIASLRSPHTVDLYDFGVTTDEIFYYVMEYLPGVDLQRLVDRYGPLPQERAVYLLRQVCDSLGDAHARGLVHRDVKPANLVVCRMGTEYDFVKVLDFGLVKSLGATPVGEGVTVEGAFIGTPAYASPEVARGDREITGAADIYSLGCVAYWLLTGTTVFEGRGAGALLAEHIKTAPQPPSTRVAAQISPQLDAVVMRCLEKDPPLRFASSRELAAALAACPLPQPWNRHRARQWWQMNDVRLHELD